MRAEVRPSVCPAGLALKWRSLTSSHSTLELQQTNQRWGGRHCEPVSRLKKKKNSVEYTSALHVSFIASFSCGTTSDSWFTDFPIQAHFMGNSVSTGFSTPTPRRLSWGRHREDTVKLEDFLTQHEEDLWRVKGKTRFSVKKVQLPHSLRYVDLESDSFYPNRGEMNPAFVGDQGPWVTEFSVDN